MRLLYAVYRYFLSPLLHSLAGPGWGCRFAPTCGEYSREAVEQHGVFRGGILSIRRVCRCHPLGPSGYDPVPLKLRG